MKLDGYDIKVGDGVYDIVFGIGKVVSLHSDSVERCTIEFSERRRMNYTSDGFGQFRRRTLFWNDPIVVIPAKNEKFWDMQKEICIKSCEVIRDKARQLV